MINVCEGLAVDSQSTPKIKFKFSKPKGKNIFLGPCIIKAVLSHDVLN